MSYDHTYTFPRRLYSEENPESCDFGSDCNRDITVEENEGDAYLIDLYRERKFLYDKREPDFKDNLKKDNAWQEISQIMLNKGKVELLL